MSSSRTIHVFEPHAFWGRGHSETCYNICAPWAASGQRVIINTTLANRPDPAGIVRAQIPKWLPARTKLALQERIGREAIIRRAEARGLKEVRPGDICYFWPGSSIDAMRKARAAGAFVVIEFINTHVAYSKSIIDDASRRREQPIRTDLAAFIGDETARLEMTDLAFAPGPFVGESIRLNSRKPPKILEVSYGTHIPTRLQREEKGNGPLRFLFVGSLDLRKGIFDLFDAWRGAALDAELLLAGSVPEDLRDAIGSLGGSGVRALGFRTDISELYCEADVFVFPSLEEGGPQVCYEAAAHGLPMIVTPMGGGRIADETNAIIVPSQDPNALASALRKMASDPELRRRMGKAAREASLEYSWTKVAERRLSQLLEAVDTLERTRA